MTVKLGTSARNAAADAIAALLNNGTFELRTGAPPTNPGDADSGTLLGAPTFGATAFGSASTGVATANALGDDTAVASGDAGHFRAKSSGSTVIAQGTAGNSGDSPDFTLDNKAIVAGGTISVSALTLTVPAS